MDEEKRRDRGSELRHHQALPPAAAVCIFSEEPQMARPSLSTIAPSGCPPSVLESGIKA
jgi:hypothetical protein